jgi:Holliday junction resolvase RusA-like endonuclease
MLNQVILPDKKPDLDNLAYLITNALKEIVYDDDKRVCALRVFKFYADHPKTIIQVRPILQAQPLGYHADDL